ncbi:SAM-dependent methyltransferase [Cryptosporangium minutisporangium]|uniref:SAM-dependent methyltransferase n=1 Tax=Cryptosporangium minutisporangium TaxID=113569 RepID=UPI0031EE6944
MDETTLGWMTPDPEAVAEHAVDLQTDRPHSARVYNHIIGGKDHFAPDREAGDALLAALPTMGISIRQSRAWLRRVSAWLASEAGLDQFLDLGTGLPTSPNVHEIEVEKFFTGLDLVDPESSSSTAGTRTPRPPVSRTTRSACTEASPVSPRHPPDAALRRDGTHPRGVDTTQV